MVRLLILVTSFFVTDVFAEMTSNEKKLEDQLLKKYRLLFVEEITNDLILNHKAYLDSANKFWDFLNLTLKPNWNFDATTKALIGVEIFNSLHRSQFKKLSRAVEVTLLRYAYESLPFYGEQKISAINTKINEQQTLAWLKINMDSSRFPDIHLDLLLRRSSDNQWMGVDFSFKGITYVNLKKNSYRQDFKELKFHGLLRKLEEKNKVFFNNLCSSGANYTDPKRPPCL